MGQDISRAVQTGGQHCKLLGPTVPFTRSPVQHDGGSTNKPQRSAAPSGSKQGTKAPVLQALPELDFSLTQ
jgi:hypothetical protein